MEPPAIAAMPAASTALDLEVLNAESASPHIYIQTTLASVMKHALHFTTKPAKSALRPVLCILMHCPIVPAAFVTLPVFNAQGLTPTTALTALSISLTTPVSQVVLLTHTLVTKNVLSVTVNALLVQ